MHAVVQPRPAVPHLYQLLLRVVRPRPLLLHLWPSFLWGLVPPADVSAVASVSVCDMAAGTGSEGAVNGSCSWSRWQTFQSSWFWKAPHLRRA